MSDRDIEDRLADETGRTAPPAPPLEPGDPAATGEPVEAPDEETTEPYDPDGIMNGQDMPTQDGEVVNGGSEGTAE